MKTAAAVFNQVQDTILQLQSINMPYVNAYKEKSVSRNIIMLSFEWEEKESWGLWFQFARGEIGESQEHTQLCHPC